MGTKEILQRRTDIPDDQVEALILRAATLQDQHIHSTENTASPDEIAAVASELDIAPEYVEQAIADWRSEQSDSENNLRRDRITQRRRKIMMGVAGIVAIIVGAVGLIAAAGVSAFGWPGIAVAASIAFGGLGFLIWLMT